MSITCWGIGLVALLLVGCNMATPSSQIAVPHFSGAKYEHLDCPSLKVKIDELNGLVQEFTVAQDNRVNNSGGHLVYYGWGTGDGMETIELAKMKGERNAVNRVYDKKGCANMDEEASR